MIRLLTHSTIETTRSKRILKYLLVYNHKHSTLLSIDNNSFTLKPNEAITITSGQIHNFHLLSESAKILEFTLDFFCKDDDDIELIFHNGLFCHFGMNEVINVQQPDYFYNIIERIEAELVKKPYQYLISIRSLIELLLIELNRSKIARGDEIWKPDALFLKFLEVVRTNFGKNYQVVQFAKMLRTTELKINELAKVHTGKTAQNVIYSLVTSEAKRLLIYEYLSVKEVAYRLGFNDPSYFSNFFKKQTKLSPKLYRERFAI